MTKKLITAILAITTTLTFCSCKSADDQETKPNDSKSTVSSEVNIETASSELSSSESQESSSEDTSQTESKNMDDSAESKSPETSKADSTSKENTTTVTAIPDSTEPDTQPETGLVIVTEEDNLSPAVTSVQADNSDADCDIDPWTGEEFELPIISPNS
jgi:hypothetical protein